MNTHSRSRAAAAATLVLALSGGLAVGCGGSSSGGGPEDAFIGRWFQQSPNPSDPTATGFTLTCNDPNFSDLSGAALIWGSLIFEHGTLTDLAETSGNCSPLNYDIKGKTATVPNPDPYIGSTPGCVIQFTNTDAAGNALPAFLILTPGEGTNWSFMLLDTKASSGAQQGRLAGSATGHIIEADASGNIVESTPDCTYAGMDTYFRLTQP
jgi:hypothetical protein